MTPDEAIVTLWSETEKFHSHVQLYDAIIAKTAAQKILDRYNELIRTEAPAPRGQEEQRLLPPPATPRPRSSTVSLSNRSVGTAGRARQARGGRLTVRTHT